MRALLVIWAALLLFMQGCGGRKVVCIDGSGSWVNCTGCCRMCVDGKPCGDSCIARSLTCTMGSGCACEEIDPSLLGTVEPPGECLYVAGIDAVCGYIPIGQSGMMYTCTDCNRCDVCPTASRQGDTCSEGGSVQYCRQSCPGSPATSTQHACPATP